ncbi:Outer membrane beta-barrel assembly protein BamE [hydrothermal vent metagenome]|uniref:Outer membrane beta-barrel assembly protein BamE n=1 Tax=hydrothermal vent metagenome TaxID=652676 RepID=A0A3B0VUK1_9ZZZZ
MALLSGCSYFQPYKTPLTQGNVMTQEAIASLQEGLSKKQVRELLGPPLGQDPFNPNHWEYIFYSANTDLHSDSAKHLVVYFDRDDMLESWKTRQKTIQLKEDKSFFGLGVF